MRKVSLVMLMVVLALFPTFVHAQDDSPTLLPTFEALATQAAESANVAIANAEESGRATDLAFNLLGIFEAVSVAITIVGAGLGGVGFLRLLSAESSLTAAREEVEKEIIAIREQFNTDLERRRGEFESLSAQLLQLVENQRKDSSNATLATTLLTFGERQYRAADYVGAVNTYLRALELDPLNPVTHYRLGYVYNQQGDLDGAESHLKQSLAIEADFPPAVATIGLVFRRKGERMPESIEREQMFNLAESHLLDALKRSTKLVDEDGESWWGALGGLYRRRNQVAQAIYAYEQATIVTPHSSYPFGNLARLYGKEQNIEGMLRMYKRVEKLAAAEVQAEVDNYWGYFDLLESQLAIGHVDKAEENLPSVLETVPSDAVYAYDVLADSLRSVAHVMEGREQHPALMHFVERITQYADQRRTNPSASKMVVMNTSSES